MTATGLVSAPSKANNDAVPAPARLVYIYINNIYPVATYPTIFIFTWSSKRGVFVAL